MTNKCTNEGFGHTGCCAGAIDTRVCGDGQRFVKKEMEQPPKIAVLACEGGCVKGEVARVAANILAYQLQRGAAVRICLGDAATGNSGMLELVKRAPGVLAVEGCPLQCGTEIMRYRLPDLKTTVINASELYEFDRSKYFEIFDMPRAELEEHAQKVAKYVQEQFFHNNKIGRECSSTGCCTGK